MVARFLRTHPVVPGRGDRHIKDAVGAERQSGAQRRRVLVPLFRHQQVADILEVHVLEAAARERNRRAVVRPALRVGEIHEVVLREVGMQHHVHQPLVRTGHDLGDTGNRHRIEHAVADDTQLTRTFRDEHSAIGQECQGEGAREPVGDSHHANLVMRRVEDRRPRRQRHVHARVGRIEEPC